MSQITRNLLHHAEEFSSFQERNFSCPGLYVIKSGGVVPGGVVPGGFVPGGAKAPRDFGRSVN